MEMSLLKAFNTYFSLSAVVQFLQLLNESSFILYPCLFCSCRPKRPGEVHRKVSIIQRTSVFNSCAEVHPNYQEEANSPNPQEAYLWLFSKL